MKVSRRSMLGLPSLLLAPAWSSAVAKARPEPAYPDPTGADSTSFHDRLDLSNPQDAHIAMIKARGSLIDEPVSFWYRGFYYGVIEGVARRLVGIETVNYSRFSRQPDGKFLLTSREIGYVFPPDGGPVLDRFNNPYTGQTVDVAHNRVGPLSLEISADGFELPEEMKPLLSEFETNLGPVVEFGEQVSFFEDVRTRFTPAASPGAGKGAPAPAFEVSDLTTYHAKVADLQNQNIASVPATFSFQSIGTGPAWLNMPGVGGHISGRGIGFKLKSLAQLPDSLRSPIEERDPDFLRDPENWAAASLSLDAV